jgi:hypothetical protein
MKGGFWVQIHEVDSRSFLSFDSLRIYKCLSV